MALLLAGALAWVAGCRRADSPAPATAAVAEDGIPRPRAELLCDVATIQPGEAFTVGIRVRLEPGWHTYWINPGDAGAPLTVTWRLPDGVTAGALAWPSPTRLEEAGLVSFAYEGELICLATLTTPDTLALGTNLILEAQLGWMVCKEVCVPHDSVLTTSVGVGAESSLGSSEAVTAISAVRAALPVVDARWQFQALLASGTMHLRVTPPAGVDLTLLARAAFFPEARGLISYMQRGQWQMDGQQATLALARSGGAPPPGALRGLLVFPAGVEGVPRALMVEAELVKQ